MLNDGLENNVEELEELEDLDTLKQELKGDDSDYEYTGGPILDFSSDPLRLSIFPVLYVDKKLRVLFANTACEKLFTGLTHLAGSYFMDLFGRSFDINDIKKIRETLLTGSNGYSWKGFAQTKSPDMVSVQTRVYIFPAEIERKEPDIFVVMFDDVTEENRGMLRAVFMSLLEASKLKDNDTGNHIVRVNYYSQRLAQELHDTHNPVYARIDADYIDNIGFLAAMHDVGKIGTPDDILNKQGPLSDWEWTVMRAHTINGGYILSTYPNPMAKDIALCHHERWNGSGYPYKLEGEMIPLAARIVSIADVYDALRMERSYKSAVPHNVSIQKIIEEGGSHFDPALIEVFKRIAPEFEQIYEENREEKNPEFMIKSV